MSKRTASEIRAYCEAASEGPWLTGPESEYWPIVRKVGGVLPGMGKYEDLLCSENAENDAMFCINARTDLLRVLDVAVKLRERLRIHGLSVGLDWDTRELMTKTAWLDELSQKPALSPDGGSVMEELWLKNKNTLEPGQPCSHPGCLSHVSHPCEGCGRIAGWPVLSSEENEQKSKYLLLNRVLRAMLEPSGSETTDANVELPARDDPATYEYEYEWPVSLSGESEESEV